MSFREKSAWAMALVMLVTGALYATLVLKNPAALHAGVILSWTLAVVILSIIVQVGLALSAPKEAQLGADERERLIVDRAGHRSSLVLSTGVASAAGLFVIDADGVLLFHLVVASLIVSHLADNIYRIVYLRRTV